jgi:hypothetical protein
LTTKWLLVQNCNSIGASSMTDSQSVKPPREREDEHGFVPKPNISKKPPWWFYGLQFVFFCLLFITIFRSGNRSNDCFYNSLIGICLSVLLIQFIREFFKQHAQFSIKSLLILTFYVAVLCSIYSCFGYEIMFWVIFISFMIISLRFGKTTEAVVEESRREHHASQDNAEQ